MVDVPDSLARALAAHYRLERELGAGGMATVYLAHDLRHDREVAIKVLRPELAATLGPNRFLQEIQIAARLTHPHILPLHDSGEAGGFLYYVMPFVDGESLRDKLTREGELPVAEVVRTLKEVTDALAYAHGRGVVHRDIKPENVMLSGRHALVTDFGVAKALHEATGRQQLTTAGIALGTPAYMSPEQAAADPHVDHRADLYAVGAMGYELLTGRPPFTGSSPQMVLAAQVTEPPRPVTDHRPAVPPALATTIMRCLEKKPADRWQTAGELLAQLEGLASTPSGGTTPMAAIDRQADATLGKFGRRRWPWALGVVAVITAVGVLLAIRAVNHPAGTEAPRRPMLVVLPFKNLGPPEDEYFADGMTEEGTARLAGLHGLGVIGRTSADRYKRTTKTITQIGQELRVEYVLEGSVRWDKPAQGSGRVRVTPQLIRVSDQSHVWAHVYDAVLADVFGVQSSIATQVAESLDVALLAPERTALATKPTANLEAYDFYLRAKDAARRENVRAEAEGAVQMYQRAVELDPTFALAYAALARAHLSLSWSYDQIGELPQAKAALDRAQQLGAELAETHLALGYYAYYGSRDYDHALEQFTWVRERQPNDPEVIGAISFVRRRQGRWPESTRYLTRATELDPRNPGLFFDLEQTYKWLRRYPEAQRPLGQAIALAPDIPWYHATRADLHLMEDGTVTRAREDLRQAATTLDPARGS